MTTSEAERQMIAAHLEYRLPGSDDEVHCVSGLVGALRDARRTTGRDLDTGTILEPAHCESWLGALGYMIFLEHVGHCYRPLDQEPARAPEDIVRALADFSPFDDDRVTYGVYALRCAFAHTYRLRNTPNERTPERKRPLLTHHFRLLSDPDVPLMTLPSPKRQWDGTEANIGPLSLTTVNLWAFGDLAEGVYAELLARNDAGTLGVRLASVEELERHFAFQVWLPKV